MKTTIAGYRIAFVILLALTIVVMGFNQWVIFQMDKFVRENIVANQKLRKARSVSTGCNECSDLNLGSLPIAPPREEKK